MHPVSSPKGLVFPNKRPSQGLRPGLKQIPPERHHRVQNRRSMEPWLSGSASRHSREMRIKRIVSQQDRCRYFASLFSLAPYLSANHYPLIERSFLPANPPLLLLFLADRTLLARLLLLAGGEHTLLAASYFLVGVQPFENEL